MRVIYSPWRALKAACKGVAGAAEGGVFAHLDRYVTELEAVYKDRDVRTPYQHLIRRVGISGRQAGGLRFVADENEKRTAPKQGRHPAAVGEIFRHPSQQQVPHSEPRRRLGAAPDLEEVEREAKGLHNSKPPGHDSGSAELLKIDDDELLILQWLHAIIVDVWEGKQILQEWKDVIIKLLYKKGDTAAIARRQGPC